MASHQDQKFYKFMKLRIKTKFLVYLHVYFRCSDIITDIRKHFLPCYTTSGQYMKIPEVPLNVLFKLSSNYQVLQI